MDGVCQYDHCIEPFVAAVSHRGLDLFPPRVWWYGMDESSDRLFHGHNDTRHVFSTQEIYPSKCDPKVGNTQDEVNPQGVPTIFLHEVFEALGERRVRWKRRLI